MSVELSSSIETQDVYTPSRLRRSRRESRHYPSLESRLSLKKDAKLRGQQESQQSKITKYFVKNDHSINNPSAIQRNQSDHDKSQNEKVHELELKLKAKQEENDGLRLKIEADRQMIVHGQEEYKKAQEAIAKSMLALADIKRKQRAKVDIKLGYFVDNFRKFIEGDVVIDLRKRIEQTEKTLKNIQEDKKLKAQSSPEYTCLQSSIEYHTRQLSELKKELEYRQAEVHQYKQRLKLAEKEQISQYNKQKWPIIYDRYQTLELLGSGGFGEVYKCYDLQTGRLTAIKKILFDSRASLKYKDQFFKHVERQAQIQKSLVHPNIAKLERVLDLDKNKNCVVFELEYCSGPELSKYMKKHINIPEKEAKIIIKQVLCALNYLSNLKERVIHYDLKPGNIMFHNGIIKILDFGLCKVMEDSQDTRIELTSQGVGTYYYLPPQTFDNFNPKICSKVDIWSVGVIFYEMLYGRKPFGQGLSQNQIYQLGTILKAKKVEFPQQAPKKYKISDGAKTFIEACLKYDPQERLSPAEAYDHPYLKKLH